MKISRLKKLAGAFFALVLGTTAIFAQGWRNNVNNSDNQVQTCINLISGLTDDQKLKIDELNKSHQVEMAKLREQRQSTTDPIEKSEIRTSMLKNVKAHREEVRSLLTLDQQKEYDSVTARGNYYGSRQGKGNNGRWGQGQGRKQFAGNCRGSGYGFRGGNGPGNGYRNHRFYRGCPANINQNN